MCFSLTLSQRRGFLRAPLHEGTGELDRYSLDFIKIQKWCLIPFLGRRGGGCQQAKSCALNCLPQWQNKNRETWERIALPLMVAGTGPLSWARCGSYTGSEHENCLQGALIMTAQVGHQMSGTEKEIQHVTSWERIGTGNLPHPEGSDMDLI